MNIAGRQLSWSTLALCGLVVLVGALAVAVFGFGIAPWVILVGAFCVVVMGWMMWMMVAMGRNVIHRH